METILKTEPMVRESSSENIPRRETGPDHNLGFLVRLPWLITALRTRRRFIVYSVVSAFILSIALSFLLPNRYQASAQLMPPNTASSASLAMLSTLGAGSAVTGGMADVLGLRTSSSLFVAVLKSRTAQDRIIEKFDLRKVYSARTLVAARKKLASRTSIDEDQKTGIVTISVTDSDKVRAAAMAEAYPEMLNQILLEVNTSGASREREFLESQLKEVKPSLEESEKRLAQFASKNMTVDVKDQGRAMVEASATLEGQLIAARAELEGLRKIYAEGSDKVTVAEATVSELTAELSKYQGISHGKDPSEYPTIKDLPLLGASYNDLFIDTEIQESTFEVLSRQYELAKIEEAKEVPSVRVLDHAEVPELHSFPPRILVIVAVTLLAAVLSVGFALFEESWKSKNPSDPWKQFAKDVNKSIHGEWADESAES